MDDAARSERAAAAGGSDGARGRLITYRALADAVESVAPGLPGGPFVIGIDGWSGSGKSFVAQNLGRELGAPVINSDDLLPGWDGLARSLDLIEEWILAPLHDGHQAAWQRFDWDLMRYTEWVPVPDSRFLIIEGCGVGLPRLARYLGFLVWVAAPEAVRRQRLPLRFDWEMYAPHVASWADQESALRDGDDMELRADLVVENGAARGSRPGGEADRGAVHPASASLVVREPLNNGRPGRFRAR